MKGITPKLGLLKAIGALIEVGMRILQVLKWLTLFVYLGLIAGFIYFAYQWYKGWIYPQLNINLLVRSGIIFGLIPIIGLGFLFYKAGKSWHFVVKAVVQGIFIVFLPALVFVFAGLLPAGMWSSVTTDIGNYYVFEEDAEEHIVSLNLDILPSSLPQNMEETSYSYHFFTAIDSILTIDASWKFSNEAEYEQEKERLLQREISATYEENGYTVCKMKLDSGINVNNSAEFGYDDETKAVFYRINGVW